MFNLKQLHTLILLQILLAPLVSNGQTPEKKWTLFDTNQIQNNQASIGVDFLVYKNQFNENDLALNFLAEMHYSEKKIPFGWAYNLKALGEPFSVTDSVMIGQDVRELKTRYQGIVQHGFFYSVPIVNSLRFE